MELIIATAYIVYCNFWELNINENVIDFTSTCRLDEIHWSPAGQLISYTE